MIKNKCEIVKDLLPNYVEKTLSPGTNEFIESHIKGCKNCRRILEDLTEEELTEENDNDNKQDIDYLKKYNRNMNVLKSVIVILIIFNILILSYIWHLLYVRITTDNNYNYNYNIINTTIKKTNEILNSNNYSFVADYGNEVSTSFYFKDNKYKRIDYGKDKTSIPEVEQVIYYGAYLPEVGFGSKYGYIAHTIHKNGHTSNSAAYGGNSKIIHTSDVNMYLDSCYNLGFTELTNLKITNVLYNNKECYLVKNYTNDDKTQWEEMWIEKDTMLIIRERKIDPDNNFDCNYTWEVGNVTNEDIALSDAVIEDWISFYDHLMRTKNKM